MSANQYVIKSAERTLEVLLAFAAEPHRFGLADLQHSTGLEKNQLYRSLKTLEAAGYLKSDDAGRYTLTDVVARLLPALPGTQRQADGAARRRAGPRRREAHKRLVAD